MMVKTYQRMIPNGDVIPVQSSFCALFRSTNPELVILEPCFDLGRECWVQVEDWEDLGEDEEVAGLWSRGLSVHVRDPEWASQRLELSRDVTQSSRFKCQDVDPGQV